MNLQETTWELQLTEAAVFTFHVKLIFIAVIYNRQVGVGIHIYRSGW